MNRRASQEGGDDLTGLDDGHLVRGQEGPGG